MPNKVTAEVRSLAREHGPGAIKELSRLAAEARSEQARISACTVLLDRAYGKSQIDQPIEIPLPDISTMQGISMALSTVVRAVACGTLRPSEGQALCNVLKAQRDAIEMIEFEERLQKLEKIAKAQF